MPKVLNLQLAINNTRFAIEECKSFEGIDCERFLCQNRTAEHAFIFEVNNVKTIIKQSSYYKNPNSCICIHFLLTNVPFVFQVTCVIETGVSDFHLLTLAVMRETIKEIATKDYKL